MHGLVAELGRPDTSFKSVVVAGTNGKGSTSHGIAWLLRQAGYCVGLYTSPHLLRFAERFVVDGSVLSDQTLIDVYDHVKNADDSRARSRPASFFELATAIALTAFAREKVDWAVLEVGLGGRLDATNVVERALSVITPVGLDHQRYLGDTLDAIAGEKAGIIERGVPVVMAPQEPAAERVIRARAQELDAPLLQVDARNLSPMECAAAVAGRAAEALGIHSNLVGSSWHPPARYQRLNLEPPVLLDTAHNIPAVQALVDRLQHETAPIHAVFNVLSDRPLSSLVEALQTICASVRVPRFGPGASDPSLLPNGVGLRAESVGEALSQARQHAVSCDGIVLIAGSFQLVAEALHRLTGAARDPVVRG